MNVGANENAKFLYALIVWEAEIMTIVLKNRAMKRLYAR